MKFSRNGDVLSLKAMKDRYMITKPLKSKCDPKEIMHNEIFVPIKPKQISIPHIKSSIKIHPLKSKLKIDKICRFYDSSKLRNDSIFEIKGP